MAKHQHPVLDLMAAHALTGCDTTAHLLGLGENAAIKVLEKGYMFGGVHAGMAEVIRQTNRYICACYGCTGAFIRHGTSCRPQTCVPELKSLPPTLVAFDENV